MKHVSRILSTYSADTFGVCSALYELGGMIVIHDPSGCNSTYTTHDEPRWFAEPSQIFISALTENQLAAAVITIAVIAGMVGIGVLNNYIDVYWLRVVLSWVSVYSRFGNFANGLFDFAAILYYGSLSFVFLFLTVRVYEKRRWG